MKKIISLLLLTLFFSVAPLAADSVPTMNKDELKSQLGTENLVILDVRTGKDWSSSEFKVQGAIRVDGKDLSAVNNYSKDKTFVLYCA